MNRPAIERRDRRSLLAALVLLSLVVPTAAAAQRTDDEWLEDCQDNDRGRNRYVHCDVRIERIRVPSGTFRVDAGPNGGIHVIGENRSDIEVHFRIQTHARSAEDARALLEEIQIEMGGSELRADGPEMDRNESWSVSFYMLVPNRIDLDLEAINGPMSIEDVTGSIEANTQNGPLSLRQLAGDVVARAQNGPLSVELTGTRWSGAGLDAETTNGPVTLTIPEGYSASLEAGTVNGPFNSDIPLTVTRLRGRDRRIETTLGRGGPPIRVVTTNGPVTIRNR